MNVLVLVVISLVICGIAAAVLLALPWIGYLLEKYMYWVDDYLRRR